MPPVRLLIWSLFLILLLVSTTDCLKILLFCPGLSRSHVLFNYRVASTLVAKGHEVVVYTSASFADDIKNLQPPSGIREIRQPLPSFPPDIMAMLTEGRQSFQNLAWEQPKGGSLLGFIRMISKFSVFNRILGDICNAALSDDAILDELRKEKFDIALTHYMTKCSLGLGTVLGIEKFIWVSPGTYIFDSAASTMRIPLEPGYIPNAMSSFMDRMSFFQRVVNWILDMIILGYSNFPYSYLAEENTVYQAAVANHSRNYAPIARSGKSLNNLAEDNIVTMFINGEEALDYPRPFLPGMMFLGQMENLAKTKELNETWKSFVSSGQDGTIMFSLGTVANTSMMPMAMKVAFLDAFKQFPTYAIIWRLEGEMPPGLHDQKHIKVVKWLPQRDLLHRANVKLFITHGGYNSLVETAQAGVPMLLLPLFGDQQGNAKRAVRHGIGLELQKTEITAETIVAKMKTLLNDPGYGKEAIKLAGFMRDKLVPNEDAAVREVEAIARSRKWSIYVSPAKKLNYVQYLCLDIIFTGLLIFTAATYLLLRLLAYAIRSFKK